LSNKTIQHWRLWVSRTKNVQMKCLSIHKKSKIFKEMVDEITYSTIYTKIHRIKFDAHGGHNLRLTRFVCQLWNFAYAASNISVIWPVRFVLKWSLSNLSWNGFSLAYWNLFESSSHSSYFILVCFRSDWKAWPEMS